jgi:hypothetical protein
MYGGDVVREALRLADLGLSRSEISRRTGVARSTLRAWEFDTASRVFEPDPCSRCGAPSHDPSTLDRGAYAYLLAMYLGDGSISMHRRNVYRLRVTLDNRYPGIIRECAEQMQAIMPGRRVLVQPRRQSNCSDVGSYSKQWPCLLPQHCSGRKHRRVIALQPWQQAIADQYPAQLLRGFIHSDGSRHLNRVNDQSYPRYMFSNRSVDIQRLFCNACDRLDVRWTQSYRWTISVAQSGSVARLDSFVGPKR